MSALAGIVCGLVLVLAYAAGFCEGRLYERAMSRTRRPPPGGQE